MTFDDEFKKAVKKAMEQQKARKNLPCEMPPRPFDWAHRYERKTFYHTPEKKNGYSASVCSKCSYEHPGSVTFFAKITIPFATKDDE